jgi:tape measure domain-containing protein
LQQRLKLLSDGFDSYGKVAETTAALASKFGMSQNEAAQAFGNAYARLRPMGASLDEVKTIFEGFNTAVKLSGSSTAEAQGAYVQLVQALGAGALRGQELNSILEQAPLLALAIAKELNTTVGSLRKFGEEGAISSAIVLKALARVRDEGASRLEKALDTPQQKVKDFQNAWERFQVALTRHIIPAVTKSLGGLATLINNISNAIDTLSAKGMAGDLNRRTSYGTKKGQIGDRSGQLDDYSKILGELQRAPQRNRAGAVIQLGVAKDIGTRLRGISATGNPEMDARIQSLQGAAMDLVEGLEKRIQAIDKAASKPGSLSSLPVTPGGSSGKEKKFEPSSRARALIAAAKKLGISPLDLATIISYETIGTFSPSIMGGTGGNYMGLIQFGPEERKKYGAYSGQSFEEQVTGPVVRYLKDRFEGVGRSTQGATLSDLYRTVNGGNPNASLQKFDGNGTIAQHIQRMTGGDRRNALNTFFGGDMANVGYDAADAAADLAEGWDQIQKEIAASFAEGQKLSQEFTRQIQLRNASSELERKILQIQFDYADREAQIKELKDKGQKQDLEALNTKIKELETLKAQLDVIYERAGLERDITEEIGKRVEGMKDPGSNFRTDVELDPSKTKTKTQEYMDQLQSELADTQAQIVSLAQTIEGEIGSAMSNAISDVISGTGTVQQAFSQMFANIGKAFIDMATQMLAKQAVLSILQMIGGGLSGGMFSGAGPYQMPGGGGYASGFTMPSFLASGGPMAAGQPYIVGEKGPELILPSQGGYVLNADQTQQALADARGAFSDNRTALNNISSTSREQLTERLLASGATSTEIKYSRVGSGDLPFVTEADMLQAARLAAQEGARMGQQRTMAALKNNPGARRTVGI